MRARRPARGAGGRALLRRRRVPVDLRLPPRRRRRVPRAARAGRAAAAADAELPLAAGGARRGQRALRRALRRRVPAAARGGRVPRPGLRASGRAARHRQGELRGHRRALAARRGARGRAARARARRRGRGDAGRDRRCCSPRARTRSGTRRSCARRGCRRTARRARATSASSRSSTCSRTCACCTTATTTARCSPCSRRRSSGSRTTRSRCSAAPRRSGRSSPGSSGRCRPGSTSATSGCCARSGSATTGSPPRCRGSRSSGCASASSASTTTTSRCSRSGTAAAATRTCASSRGSRARTRSCAAPTSRASSASSREQEAVGARELEAVAEEEGADAVRLLTIHAAKGLEFKVVIVADAGRDKAPPSPDEILALSDGRFGFRVADPVTTKRRGAFDYEEVKEARERRGGGGEAAPLLRRDDAREGAADRLRLDRPREDGRRVDADRLGARPARGRRGARRRPATAPVELERDDARLVVRVDRYREGDWRERAGRGAVAPAKPGSSRSSPRSRSVAVRRAAPELPPLVAPPEPPLHRVRRLSFTALSTFEQCSYKYFALRVAGMTERRPERRGAATAGCARPRSATPSTGCSSRSTSRAPAAPDLEQVREWYPTVSDDELERIRVLRRVVLRRRSSRARIAALAGVDEGAALHVRARRRAPARLPRRAAPRRDAALVVDYKTNVLGDASPEEIVDDGLPAAAARVRARVLPRRRGGGRGRLPLPRAAGRGRRRRRSRATQLPELEAELSAAIARIHAGEFRPTPSDFACSGCPALDLVCAGPRLRGGGDPVGAPLAAVEWRRSFVSEARKRVGAEARAHPPDHRAARGRARGRDDRAHVPQPARAARLGDALRADDRRERQPRDGDAVPEVPPARGLSRGAAGGARARHLRDRLLPPEGEVAARHDADADRGVRRRGAAHARRSSSGCPASRARRRTSSRRSSATRRASSSTRTCAGSRSGSGCTKQEDPVKIERDLVRLVPREDWAAVPASADLARPPRLRRAPAALRGLRRHRPLPVEPCLSDGYRLQLRASVAEQYERARPTTPTTRVAWLARAARPRAGPAACSTSPPAPAS